MINCSTYQTACNNKCILAGIIYIPILLLFMYTIMILQINYFTQPAIAYPCVRHQIIVLWHLNLFHRYLQLLP